MSLKSQNYDYVWYGLVCFLPGHRCSTHMLRHFSFRDTLTEVRTPYLGTYTCNAAVHAQHLAGGFGRPNGDKTTQNSRKMPLWLICSESRGSGTIQLSTEYTCQVER